MGILTKSPLFTACLVCIAHVTFGAPLPGQIMLDPENNSFLVYNKDDDKDGKPDPAYLCGPGGPEGYLYGEFTSGWTQQSIIDFVARNGGNTMVVIVVRSGGDGGSNQNPWINSKPDNGLDRTKMSKWKQWFTAMDNAGISLYLQIYDDNVGHVGGDKFIADFVSEFKFLKRVMWCVAEEANETWSASEVKRVGGLIRAADGYGHPVGADQGPGTSFAYTGSLNVFGMQTAEKETSADQVHANCVAAFSKAARKYVCYNTGNHYIDPEYSTFTDAVVRRTIWAMAMAGTYHAHHGLWETHKAGRKPPTVGMCKAYRVLQTFLESTKFNKMGPNDQLAHGSTKWVLAKPGDSYIAYSYSAGGNLGIKGMTAGSYSLRWLDCVTGNVVTQAGVNVGSGDQTWPKPDGFGNEVAVYIKLGSMSTVVRDNVLRGNPIGEAILKMERDAETAHLRQKYLRVTDLTGRTVLSARGARSGNDFSPMASFRLVAVTTTREYMSGAQPLTTTW